MKGFPILKEPQISPSMHFPFHDCDSRPTPKRPSYAQYTHTQSAKSCSPPFLISHVLPLLPRSSRLKLHHSANPPLAPLLPMLSKSTNSPLRPLLVQNTMSTLLATYRIPPLQRDLSVAVAAEVVDCRTVHSSGAGGEVVAAGGSWDRGGDLVCFA